MLSAHCHSKLKLRRTSVLKSSLLVSLFASILACAQTPSANNIPKGLKMCHDGSTQCALWVFDGNEGNGSGPEPGEVEKLFVDKADDKEVIIRSEGKDRYGHPSSSVYIGTRSANGFSGTYTYKYVGYARTYSGKGAWQATLIPESEMPEEPRIITTISRELQEKLCAAPVARLAMQKIQGQEADDPVHSGLKKDMVKATGVDMPTDPGTLIDSMFVDDKGRYTTGDTGAFVCRATFLRAGKEAKLKSDNFESAILKEQMDFLLAKYPYYFDWYKVEPWGNGRYKIMNIQQIPYARVYQEKIEYGVSRPPSSPVQ